MRRQHILSFQPGFLCRSISSSRALTLFSLVTSSLHSSPLAFHVGRVSANGLSLGRERTFTHTDQSEFLDRNVCFLC